MSRPCGCCEGTRAATPVSVANPPALDALAYRAGTHGTFLETMLARLTTHELPGEGFGRRPLQALTTRTSDDPSIALLDAWATVADVLTFYQERIANEGFLRTAIERRSLVELGRLLGYELRPAISSTAYLAFTLADDPASAEGVTIATGTRAQSMPPPGGLPASFETAEDLLARPAWNTLLPRTEQPQRIDRVRATFMPMVVLEGAVQTLASGDLLLFELGDGEGHQVVRRIVSLTIDHEKKRTTVALGLPIRERCQRLAALLDEQGREKAAIDPPADQLRALAKGVLELATEGRADRTLTGTLSGRVRTVRHGVVAALEALDKGDADSPTRTWLLQVVRLLTEADPRAEDQEAALSARREKSGGDPIGAALSALTAPLTRAPSSTPASAARLTRDSRALFAAGGDLSAQLLSVLRPELAGMLHRALSEASLAVTAPLKALYGLSKHPQPFGATAPLAPEYKGSRLIGSAEWFLDGHSPSIAAEGESPHSEGAVALDGLYPSVHVGSWVVVERPRAAAAAPPTQLDVRRVTGVVKRGVGAYHMAASVTQLELGKGWLGVKFGDDTPLTAVRHTTIHLDAEPLTLAPEPIGLDVAGESITLDGVQDGLLSGRRLIVTGERTDIPGVTGVRGGELVMLAAAEQRVDTTLPGDKVHTVLRLATALSYRYARTTVKVWANVAKSTHGETHAEVLGGGDPTQPLQTFQLSLGPLTNLPAANAAGALNTLEVRVDGVAWHETDDLMSAQPGDREYLVQTDDDGATHAIFAGPTRLPSGPDNVRAVYRAGSGSGGNVEAGKISQLLTRPLGVRDVINPLLATGGADREGIASARRSLPIGVMALDRLVSLRDYADFARARAGIGKASATRISDGHAQFVHVTVAGVDDDPLSESSDLFVALRESLVALGDPSLPLVVAVRALRLIVLVAGVRVQPDYAWPEVEPRLRAALLDALGFDRRELGEAVVLSKVIAAAQAVPGVDSVDVDAMALVPEEITPDGLEALVEGLADAPPDRLLVAPARAPEGSSLLAAELAVLSPRVPDTLILNEVTA